ncbi:MAG TPA: hypothetical protein VHE99_00290 [Gammaproteobacteria bacterium]|nr:hypothetical protein [Gammaproteobacteria bacterium]
MFADLPQTIKQQVLCYLEVDNFIAAKALYDQHSQKNCSNSNKPDSHLNSDVH